MDTRELTKKIRYDGVMNAKIVMDKSENQNDESFDYNYNFMPEVSISKPTYYGKESYPKIVLIDTGP